MARLLALVLLTLILLLQMKYWVGAGGVREVEALRTRVTQQQAENQKLTERNEALQAEVEDLRAGKSALEERARAELGMIKPGETFYRVIAPQTPTTPELRK